jgi:hypothetical protein
VTVGWKVQDGEAPVKGRSARLRAIISAYPALAAALFLVGYAYDAGFLLQFDLAPADVGVAWVPLLSMSALYAAGISAGICIFIGPAMFVIWLFEPARRPNKSRESLPKRLRRRFPRIVGLGGLATLGGVAMFLVVYSLAQVDPGNRTVFALISAVVTGVLLHASLRAEPLFPSTVVVALLAVYAYGLLSYASFSRGGDDGVAMENTGQGRSELEQSFGMDVREVQVSWLDDARPHGIGTEDMIELGSASGTVFLYDCKTSTTYRLDGSDVVVADAYSAAIGGRTGNLQCSPALQ